MALTYSARTRKKRIYKPPQTSFQVPCGTKVRKKKKSLRSLVDMTIIPTIPHYCIQGKNLRKGFWAI